MDDPNDPLDPSLSLTKKGSKTPMIVIGLLAAGAIGYFIVHSMQRQNERKAHAALLDSFANIEKDDLGKFWGCLLGPNVNIEAIPDNLVLVGRITGQFGLDPTTYPQKVNVTCTPMAIDAMHKVESLSGPAVYTDALKKYAGSLKELATSLDAWSRIAPAQVQDMQVAKLLDSDSAAWHSFAGGKPPKEVEAYDRFLHCAIPDVDKMKDGQAEVEFLFKQCKDAAYLTKLDSACGKELTDEMAMGGSKNLVATQRRLASDSRETEAFDDCLRSARKSKRRDDFAEVGKAFVSWTMAGADIRKIGKAALAE
jgi:hypothetical protein